MNTLDRPTEATKHGTRKGIDDSVLERNYYACRDGMDTLLIDNNNNKRKRPENVDRYGTVPQRCEPISIREALLDYQNQLNEGPRVLKEQPSLEMGVCDPVVPNVHPNEPNQSIGDPPALDSGDDDDPLSVPIAEAEAFFSDMTSPNHKIRESGECLQNLIRYKHRRRALWQKNSSPGCPVPFRLGCTPYELVECAEYMPVLGNYLWNTFMLWTMTIKRTEKSHYFEWVAVSNPNLPHVIPDDGDDDDPLSVPIAEAEAFFLDMIGPNHQILAFTERLQNLRRYKHRRRALRQKNSGSDCPALFRLGCTPDELAECAEHMPPRGLYLWNIFMLWTMTIKRTEKSHYLQWKALWNMTLVHVTPDDRGRIREILGAPPDPIRYVPDDIWQQNRRVPVLVYGRNYYHQAFDPSIWAKLSPPDDATSDRQLEEVD